MAKVLEINDMSVFRSYVVFSERCGLAKINISKPNVKVIKRNQLNNVKNEHIKYVHKIIENSKE